MSKETISRITDSVVESMTEWRAGPLDSVYPVIMIDAIRVTVRDGQVANRPICLALAVSTDGRRDIPGLWAGDHGDGECAAYWLRVLTEIENRGVTDAINTAWPQATVQTCVIHLLRNSYRYASRRDCDGARSPSPTPSPRPLS